MPVEIKYIIRQDERSANIREFVCKAQSGKICKGENPLYKFNELLDWVVEQAFEDGVNLALKHPDIFKHN